MILQKLFYTLVLFILLISCQRDKNPCLLSKDILNAIKTQDSLISLPEIQERYQEWSREREEPVLINYGKEAYRFSWSHTFGGAEVYRIEKKNNRYSATVKIYVSAFGTYEDSLVHSSEKWISEATWIEITEGLNENSFWTYPPTIERRGLDGAVWSLEGYNPTKNKCTRQNYHNIGRWSPIDSIFVSMCDLFMNLKER